MGWSCSNESYKTMERWQNTCIAQTGSSNTFVLKGQKFFFEPSRTEHNDGAITGSIYRFEGENHARKCASFRIEGDGKVSRGGRSLPA